MIGTYLTDLPYLHFLGGLISGGTGAMTVPALMACGQLLLYPLVPVPGGQPKASCKRSQRKGEATVHFADARSEALHRSIAPFRWRPHTSDSASHARCIHEAGRWTPKVRWVCLKKWKMKYRVMHQHGNLNGNNDVKPWWFLFQTHILRSANMVLPIDILRTFFMPPNSACRLVVQIRCWTCCQWKSDSTNLELVFEPNDFT